MKTLNRYMVFFISCLFIITCSDSGKYEDPYDTDDDFDWEAVFCL